MIMSEPTVNGIKDFKKLFDLNKENIGFVVDVYDDGNFEKVKDITDEGIETVKRFYPWERVYFSQNGLYVSYGSSENDYFYLKRTPEEEMEHPYNYHLEKKANLEDVLRDNPDAIFLSQPRLKLKETMNIRKIIREQLEDIVNSGDHDFLQSQWEDKIRKQNGIHGFDIYQWLIDIPKTRAEVDWNKRPHYYFPNLTSGDVTESVFDKEGIVEYVHSFRDKFDELPLFKIEGRNVTILNLKFLKWKNDYIEMKSGALKDLGTTD